MPSEITSLTVEFLFSMHLNLGRNALLGNGPHGTRVFAPVLNGTVVGPRINAIVSPGSDWVTVRSDGHCHLDVRLTLLTDDKAVIAMTYNGILDVGDDRRARTAPLFQAGAERYLWLNNVQAIGIGTPTGSTEVTYEVYGLL